MLKKLFELILNFLNNIKKSSLPTAVQNLIVRRDKMEKFNKCLPFVFEHEGYKSNSKNDPGKLTIWGIASLYYPTEVALMDKMSADDAKVVAKDIYYKNYWVPMKCDQYEDNLALAIFDSAVNNGVPQVQKWLAELGSNFIAKDILLRRMARYAEICNNNRQARAKDPTIMKIEDNLLGWLNRVIDLWHYKLQ